MNILFIQKQAFPYFGVMSMAGYLQGADHSCDCLIDNLDPVHKKVEELRHADIIGISVLSSEHCWMIDCIERVKKVVPDTPIIIGGVHAILYPEILGQTKADLLCAGEGETILSQVLNGLSEAGRDFDRTRIPGLVYRENGKIKKNRLPALIQDLDWLEDRDVYYRRYKILRVEGQKQFLSGRGCPHRCNFCFNDRFQEIFQGLGRYVRKKPVDVFIEEIKRTESTYGARVLFFSDDTFSLDRQWLTQFLRRYREEIDKPFMCVVRADHIDEEIARDLAVSGCHTISMGVETGNETIRNATLNKGLSDETLRRAAGCLRKNKIRLQTSNMFGIPGETVEDALQTIRFNIELGASFAFTAMLMPLPGTGIEKAALKLGWLEKPLAFAELPQSFFSGSVFKAPEIDTLENVKDIAYWCVAYPGLYKILTRIVHLRCRCFFGLLNKAGLFFRYQRERKMSLVDAARMFWRYRSSR